MLEHLEDAIFSFAISDGKKLFAARDLLGIKTLFYGKNNGSLYLSSELKGLNKVTDDVNEFPPGHYMDEEGRLKRFAELPKEQPQQHAANLEQMTESLREITRRSLLNRVSFNVPTASLLSGGIDSSVVAWLASNLYKEKWGVDRRLKTFALGVGESGDIKFARIMADFLKSEHYELMGDEIFCSYQHLKASHARDLFKRQMECLGLLHNNAALRLDRMNLCNAIRVVTPLISGDLLKFSMAIKPDQKIASKGNQKIEKWIFRKAYEKQLPKKIVWRSKQEFSQGSGTAEIFQDIFNNDIDDAELEEYQHKYPFIRSKEELSYFKLFKTYFGADKAVKTVGQWISL